MRFEAEVASAARVQEISIGVHPAMFGPPLIRCISLLAHDWPETTVRLCEGYSKVLARELIRGDLDFAICALPEGEDTSEFVIEPLVQQSYAVIARSGHPVFGELDQKAASTSYPWAVIEGVTQPGGDFLEHIRQAGLSDPRLAVRTLSMSLMRSLLLDSDFLGVLPHSYIAEDLATGGLRCIPDTGMEAPRIGFLTLRNSYETPAVRAFKSTFRLGLLKQVKAA